MAHSMMHSHAEPAAPEKATKRKSAASQNRGEKVVKDATTQSGWAGRNDVQNEPVRVLFSGDTSRDHELLAKVKEALAKLQAAVDDAELLQAAHKLQAILPAQPRKSDDQAAIRKTAVFNKLENRANAWRQQELTRPDMLPLEEAAKEIGRSGNTLNTWRHKQKALALSVGSDHGFRYPSWQFEAELIDRGIRDLISQLLSVESAWTAYRLLTTPAQRLGDMSPVDALRSGRGNEVRKYIDYLCEDQGAA